MKNKYIKSLGGEEEEVLGSKGRIVSTEESAKRRVADDASPAASGRLYRTGSLQEESQGVHRGSEVAQRAAGSCAPLWTAGTRQDHHAKIIANELGSQFKVTSGPAHRAPGELASILTTLQDHDVLFIDEIHRLNRNVEEILYSAMEDFSLDIVMGKGTGASSIRIDLAHFTLIGATRGQALFPRRCVIDSSSRTICSSMNRRSLKKSLPVQRTS